MDDHRNFNLKLDAISFIFIFFNFQYSFINVNFVWDLYCTSLYFIELNFKILIICYFIIAFIYNQS